MFWFHEINFPRIFSLWMIEWFRKRKVFTDIVHTGQQIRSKLIVFKSLTSYFSARPYYVTTHWNRLEETISMRVTSYVWLRTEKVIMNIFWWYDLLEAKDAMEEWKLQSGFYSDCLLTVMKCATMSTPPCTGLISIQFSNTPNKTVLFTLS